MSLDPEIYKPAVTSNDRSSSFQQLSSTPSSFRGDRRDDVPSQVNYAENTGSKQLFSQIIFDKTKTSGPRTMDLSESGVRVEDDYEHEGRPLYLHVCLLSAIVPRPSFY